ARPPFCHQSPSLSRRDHAVAGRGEKTIRARCVVQRMAIGRRAPFPVARRGAPDHRWRVQACALQRYLTAPSLRICDTSDVDASPQWERSVRMKKLLRGTLLASLSASLLSSLLALLLALLLASPTQASGGPTLRAALSAANETPPNNSGGAGFATVTLNPGHQTICFTITVSQNVLPATAAHIHVAPVGQPGPIVVPLLAAATLLAVGLADIPWTSVSYA